ncbi:hypothetical protein ApDm4_0091 [Acetobacter pomorum]|nr:hypothetical protein ApDm4_0091 [Acetobacter pomorum]
MARCTVLTVQPIVFASVFCEATSALWFPMLPTMTCIRAAAFGWEAINRAQASWAARSV